MKRSGFWDKEYHAKHSGYFALSDEPSSDLEKFTRFLMRRNGKELLNVTRQALDVGCGNGRNLRYLAETFGMRGVGYDLSEEAIAQARRNTSDIIYDITPVTVKCEVHDLRNPLPLPDDSVTIALDMMVSHVLKKDGRERLKTELHRVLKPGGWLLFKSFLLEEDQNAALMLREHPGPEAGMYLHPKIKVAEYVWPSVHAVEEFFSPLFTVHKTEKSFKHITKAGKPWKRRSIVVYLEKQG